MLFVVEDSLECVTVRVMDDNGDTLFHRFKKDDYDTISETIKPFPNAYTRAIHHIYHMREIESSQVFDLRINFKYLNEPFKVLHKLKNVHHVTFILAAKNVPSFKIINQWHQDMVDVSLSASGEESGMVLMVEGDSEPSTSSSYDSSFDNFLSISESLVDELSNV